MLRKENGRINRVGLWEGRKKEKKEVQTYFIIKEKTDEEKKIQLYREKN